MLKTLILASVAAATALTTTAAECPCYQSTTTVLDPTCSPWHGICPAIICASPTATATAAVAPNYEALDVRCKRVPTITAYRACTTDCGPITCPSTTVTKTLGKNKQCCTAW